MADKVGIQAEIDLLSELERAADVTQTTLSQRVVVSVGLINALMKRAVQKGYVKVRTAPYKRYAYYLTPTGFAEKSRLVAEYLDISLDFFRLARAEYGDLFARTKASGIERVIFMGSGELAEIAFLSARASEVDVIAILDDEANRRSFYGVPVVRSFDELPEAGAIVVCDAKSPQTSFDLAAECFPEHLILAPRLMRISRRATTENPLDEAAQ